MEHINRIGSMIDENSHYHIFKEEVVKKSLAFHHHYRNTDLQGKIRGNIHLIKAIDCPENALEWKELTDGDYKVYDGFGNHWSMMGHPSLEENSRIIKDILANWKA